MRKKIVAGNWKMNNNLEETLSLLDELKTKKNTSGAEVMVAPSFVNLYVAKTALENSEIEVIAQNVHHEENGAYTGEVNSNMLQSIGVNTIIVGHSERRLYFRENSEDISKKIDIALSNNMRVIFCCGEQLIDRTSGNHFKVIQNQVSYALFHLTVQQLQNIVIAYEPVWAIGTGHTATPEQVQEMHEFIRGLIASKYSENFAEGISILYGGSVKPNNAKNLFANKDVDGGLIGGASLKADDFFEIVNAF
jgi:triosephosphate isomerase (TIM)